jgi:hypothetical protein
MHYCIHCKPSFSQDQKYSSFLSLKFTNNDQGGMGVAGQKPTDVAPWTTEAHG